MKEELIKLIEEKSPGAIPLYLVIRGSHAYGTNIETSDTDYAGVFIQSIDNILGLKYKEQINDDTNDTVIYEVRRFLELLSKSNPTVLELLNTPEDCVIYKHPVFDLLLNDRDKFITKVCAMSFGGYAKAQIGKAKGQDKKQNWEKDRVTRKDLLDFCSVIREDLSGNMVYVPWKNWNVAYHNYDERFIGATKIPHAKDMYRLYYDEKSYEIFGKDVSCSTSISKIAKLKDEGKSLGLGYKGLIKVGESNNLGVSNQLRLSSIPKDEVPIRDIHYDKDGYSTHCREFREYEEWLAKRNDQRWVDVKSHGQKIDGKNMLHCVRLIDMSYEIASGMGIIVKRENAKELISIRRGEVDLQTLIDNVESKIKEMDILFKESNLPDKVDEEFSNNLLIKIRKTIYGI